MINQDQPTTDTAGNEITPEEFVAKGQAAQAAADELILLTNVRNCLKRWTHRFAASPHAVAHVKESSDLITKLDARIKTLTGGILHGVRF